MEHTNHLESISITNWALDHFMESWTNKAKTYNALCKLGCETEADHFYHEFWGMAEALRTIGIGYHVEYDDELVYLTALGVWCGKLELTAKLN